LFIKLFIVARQNLFHLTSEFNEVFSLENFSPYGWKNFQSWKKFGKILEIAWQFSEATEFSVKFVLCSPTLHSGVGLRPQSSSFGVLKDEVQSGKFITGFGFINYQVVTERKVYKEDIIFILMKILALSDIHGDKGFMREMAEKGAREKVDLVILAGDIVEKDGPSEGMIGPFKEKGLEVAVLPGNHEGMAEINFITERYNAKNLHGYSLKVGDVGIFGCGYGDIGMHQLNEKEFFETLKKAHESIKNAKKKIMVTHVHPSGSKMERFTKFFPGSTGVKKAIDTFKPDILLCSHVHEAEGIEEMIGQTKVINVGRKGKIIEL